MYYCQACDYVIVQPIITSFDGLQQYLVGVVQLDLLTPVGHLHLAAHPFLYIKWLTNLSKGKLQANSVLLRPADLH